MSRYLAVLIVITLTACTPAPIQDMDATLIPSTEATSEVTTAPTEPPTDAPTTDPTEAPSLTPEATPTSALSLPDFYQRIDIDFQDYYIAGTSADAQRLLLNDTWVGDLDYQSLDLLDLATNQRITLVEGSTFATRLSSDGSTVAFFAYSDALAGGSEACDSCGSLYSYDVATGTMWRYITKTHIHTGPRTERIAVSGDGRYIAYIGNEGTYTLFLLDQQTGDIELLATGAFAVDISDDGSIIAYVKLNGNVHDIGANLDVYRLDRSTGYTKRITESPVNAHSGAWWGEGPSGSVVLSPDGRYIQFYSTAPGLTEIDLPLLSHGGTAIHMYLYDHVTDSIELTDLSDTNEPVGVRPSLFGISPDARYAAFLKDGIRLGNQNIDGWQTYIRDRELGRTVWVPADQEYAFGTIIGDKLLLSISDYDRTIYDYYLVPIADLFAQP